MIYVDSPTKYVTALPYKTWSHLWTDNPDLEELHQFAAQLGLKRRWFQDDRGNRKGRHYWLPHYDVVPSKRALAIKLGATPMQLDRYWLQEAVARGAG